MLPVIDIINHRCYSAHDEDSVIDSAAVHTKRSHLTVKKTTNGVAVIARDDAPLLPGSTLCVSYGNKGNEELMLGYGFALQVRTYLSRPMHLRPDHMSEITVIFFTRTTSTTRTG